MVLYGCERLIRAFRSSIKAVTIRKVAVYPGNVLAIHLSRPQNFKYKSGQYMFVNCAAVSPFEWYKPNQTYILICVVCPYTCLMRVFIKM